MKINTLGTGSKGNCYILTSGKTNKQIVLDCGVSFYDVTHNDNFNGIDNLDFVFVSHEHKDHSEHKKDFLYAGCTIVDFETRRPLKIGQWEILTFEVVHNVPNLGIIIKDTLEDKTFCYVTDFSQMPIIKNVDFWLYEINHDEQTIMKALQKNTNDSRHITNSLNNHNSLEKAERYFSNEKIKRPDKIVICHLSRDYGNNDNILKTMKRFAKNVRIARKGD